MLGVCACVCVRTCMWMFVWVLFCFVFVLLVFLCGCSLVCCILLPHSHTPSIDCQPTPLCLCHSWLCHHQSHLPFPLCMAPAENGLSVSVWGWGITKDSYNTNVRGQADNWYWSEVFLPMLGLDSVVVTSSIEWNESPKLHLIVGKQLDLARHNTAGFSKAQQQQINFISNSNSVV